MSRCFKCALMWLNKQNFWSQFWHISVVLGEKIEEAEKLINFRGATARHHHFMAVAISLVQSTLFSKPSIFLRRNALNGFSFSIPFSSSSAQKIQSHKWRQPVVSVLELGGVKIGKDGNIPNSRIVFERICSFDFVCLICVFADFCTQLVSFVCNFTIWFLFCCAFLFIFFVLRHWSWYARLAGYVSVLFVLLLEEFGAFM